MGAAQIGEAVEDVGQGGRREGERQEGDDPFAVQDGGFQQTFDADPFTVTNEEVSFMTVGISPSDQLNLKLTLMQTTWLDVSHSPFPHVDGVIVLSLEEVR